jgi:tRNA pseudouridine38-40 synthase
MSESLVYNKVLMVQYDGTAFAGWQFQPACRTVQGVLAEAVTAMVHHPVELFASSRTDAGVHARAMPVAFDTTRTIAAGNFLRGLNALLPPDVSVTGACEGPAGFRPREASVAKTYVYQLQTGPRRALRARSSWWLRRQTLDVAAMQEAARHFLGEHDYRAFRSVHCDSRSTARHIHAASVSGPDIDGVVSFEVTGNAFLRNMVRIMAGALVAVGVGRRPPAWIAGMLASGQRDDAAQTAPPEGLTLYDVHFSGYPRIGKADPGAGGLSDATIRSIAAALHGAPAAEEV